ncbi:tumor necrosis factor alpha-induced protein 3-like isoform X1 [Acipenser ruthenus]|uniref:tumor necrosis factor alpha-induced protein 3-like isoform X1 n=1 Tax=Acipenser ruthenus TaxID=7906 RepID=UPI00274090D9|nr:tumor necrosis factor alpha-induced protein 3-like isoform X1 [Acipenser ruthenus]XP_033878496.3 tumor necrosis factor alpha-induced protein 3-like isoform X1 [Acipenser ruthenus]XP_058853388.1 tumor necrosis factor alpha-induced protein 3-like isoform X1 [Acipenser ruthenus]
MEVRNPLPQSLEDSNLTKALRLRERIAADITRRLSQRPSIHHLRSLHQHSVHLCGYKSSSARCRDLIKESLCDPRLLRRFEDSRGLNWSKQVRRLFPLKNPGKNNSLLDAVSLYMWGVCDADSVLHAALYRTLAESSAAELRLAAPRRAARYTSAHLPPDSGFCAEEWQNIVKTADPKAKAETSLINFYQDIYLHVLANIIRRPIIVIAGSSKESSSVSSDAVPNPAGVYLPLLWESDECCRFPVVLGYSSHHFTPLVNVSNPGAEMDALPLVMPTAHGMVALPAPFLPDSEQRTKQQFLNKYLNITAVYLEGNVTETVFAARLQGNNLPEDLSLVQDYFKLVHHTCRQVELTMESERAQDVSRKQENHFSPSGLSITADNCLTSGCIYFCSKFTQPFCHKCFKDFQSKGPPPRSCHSHQESRRQDRKENSSDRTTFYGNASPSEVKLPTGPASAPAASSNLSFFNEVSVQNCRTPQPGNLTQAAVFSDPSQRLVRDTFTENEVSPQEPADSILDFLGGRCIICKKETRTFNGLCFACLQIRAEASRPEGPQPSSSLEGLHPSFSMHSEELQDPVSLSKDNGKLCITPGCQYFGTPQHFGRCTVCYIASQGETGQCGPEKGDAGVPSDQPPQVSSVLRNMPRCCVPGCSMLGNPRYNGCCEKCFILNQNTGLQRSGSNPSAAHPGQRTASPNRQHYRPPAEHELLCENFMEKAVLGTRKEPIGPAGSDQSATANPEQAERTCRASGCRNYGNSKCEGYCNECYHRIRSRQ